MIKTFVSQISGKTKARNQEQKTVKPAQQGEVSSPYYCVQLLNYCQSNGKGIPRYNFFTVPDGKFRAQIVLSDGRTAIGDESSSKQEASEQAAKKILDDIIQGINQNSSNWDMQKNVSSYTKPSGFPSPPKQWCQKDSRTQKQYTGSPNAYNKVNKPLTSRITDKRNESNNAKSTFVPLQAVKQPRQRTGSNISEENVLPNRNTVKKETPDSPKKKNNTNIDKQKDHQGQSTSKPKQRKSRIAANFSAIPPKK